MLVVMSRTRSIVTALVASVVLAGVGALTGCGEPILRNAPKPNPAAVAGAAAAAAAAITLASPQTAARIQEQKAKGEPDNRGVPVHETVPSDVFDRLEHPPAQSATDDAGVDARAPAAARSSSADDDLPPPPPMILPPPREP